MIEKMSLHNLLFYYKCSVRMYKQKYVSLYELNKIPSSF